MKQAHKRKFELLIEEGQLLETSASKGLKKVLQQFVESSAVELRPKPKAFYYVVLHKEALQQHLDYHFPKHEVDPNLPGRGQAVLRSRNSKQGKTHMPDFLLLRSSNPQDVWRREGHSLRVAEQTKSCGLAALSYRLGDDWYSDAPLALIENKEPFFNHDHFYSKNFCSQVAYYAGNLKNDFIDWLSEGRCPKIYIFPDFDAVGICNYLRLKEKLQDKVELALPENLEEHFRQFSCEKLRCQQSNLSKIHKLRDLWDEDTEKVVKLIINMAGLEQEALYMTDGEV